MAIFTIVEEWKGVPDFTDSYQVSNKGTVRSVDRVGTNKNGVEYFKKGKMLSPSMSAVGGYKQVNLYKNNKQYTFKVHQLVAMTFLNHKPCGYAVVVDHIDYDKTNNNVDNLQLISHQDNCRRQVRSNTGELGVYWHIKDKKYVSCFTENGIKYNCGSFDTIQEAKNARHNKLTEVKLNN